MLSRAVRIAPKHVTGSPRLQLTPVIAITTAYRAVSPLDSVSVKRRHIFTLLYRVARRPREDIQQSLKGIGQASGSMAKPLFGFATLLVIIMLFVPDESPANLQARKKQLSAAPATTAAPAGGDDPQPQGTGSSTGASV